MTTGFFGLAGFSRDIPGYSRYRMNGSVSLGEHDLVIESAQLSDDAEFQCQVTPAAGDPPLVGTARLSVIGESSPPSPPVHSRRYTSLPTCHVARSSTRWLQTL